LRREPRLRQLFGPDLGHQGMSFMKAIEAIVQHLDHPRELDAVVDDLGAIHAPFHIRPDHYRAMEDSLIDTMAYALGEHLTNPVERAWRSAFGQVGAAMIERGRKDAGRAKAVSAGQ
jgi:hemoglobin-like flavoprotein